MTSVLPGCFELSFSDQLLARKAEMGSSLLQTVIILRFACTGRLTTQQCLLAFYFGSVK